ncbi:MAG: hypothetical protein HY906_15875 [Deltaproteobacteria bacterium]|nr:hypothetical protein [Deltaproteobacteria bacterium]
MPDADGPDRTTDTKTRALRGLALIALATAGGAISLDGGFMVDDERAVRRNPVVTGAVPAAAAFRRDFWGTPLSEGVRSYRPLTPLVWRAVAAAWPGSPFPFRLLNLLGHLAAAWMLYSVARRLAGDSVGWAAAMLFAAHGVHAEAIGSIVASADLLAAVLGLAALWLVVTGTSAWRATGAAGCIAVACLVKESAVVFGVGVAVVLALDGGTRARRLALVAPAVLVTAAVVVLQLALPRHADAVSGVNNLAQVAGPLGRLLHGLYIVGRGLAMCFVPVGLAPLHHYAAVDLAPSTLLPYAIPGALFVAAGVIAFAQAVRQRDRAAVLTVVLLFGPVLLQSSLVVPVVTELAERLLYPASMASCAILAAVVLRRVTPRRAALALGVAGALLAAQSWRVGRAWRSDSALWTYAVKVEPRAHATQSGYGTALLHQRRITEAAWHRMVERHIERSFPKAIDWTPIEKVEALPPAERVIAGPAALSPGAPCEFIADWLRFIQPEVAAFTRWIAPKLEERYHCRPPEGSP